MAAARLGLLSDARRFGQVREYRINESVAYDTSGKQITNCPGSCTWFDGATAHELAFMTVPRVDQHSVG
jgi:hypothetical protein